jgi:squalene cyclase
MFSYKQELICCLEPIDRSVECTSSVLQALIMFRDLDHGYRKEEIGNCIESATKFIEKEQRKDGSWSQKFYCLLYANNSNIYMALITRFLMI